jgi:threonine-phosphate decarboxylase
MQETDAGVIRISWRRTGKDFVRKRAADLIYTLVFAEKPKRAVVAVPTFTEYAQALKASGCEIVSYHLQKAGQFALEEDYLDLLTEDTDMIFLCSPNNPTGQTIPKELLEQILKRCVRYPHPHGGGRVLL